MRCHPPHDAVTSAPHSRCGAPCPRRCALGRASERAGMPGGAVGQVATGTPRLLARVEGRVGVLVFNSPERRNALGDDFSPFLRAMVPLNENCTGLWPKLWANFSALILGIFSQSFGASLAIWANPPRFRSPPPWGLTQDPPGPARCVTRTGGTDQTAGRRPTRALLAPHGRRRLVLRRCGRQNLKLYRVGPET